MSSLKQLKQLEKSALQQQQVIQELKTIVKDIERCEKTIHDLQRELTAVNSRYPVPRTTREDIAYLTDLLKCANKKLAWEKQIASLQKRTPALLDRIANLINDPSAAGGDAARAAMLASLQKVQAAMERLQSVKVE